jgi:hypothetical protein
MPDRIHPTVQRIDPLHRRIRPETFRGTRLRDQMPVWWDELASCRSCWQLNLCRGSEGGVGNQSCQSTRLARILLVFYVVNPC